MYTLAVDQQVRGCNPRDRRLVTAGSQVVPHLRSRAAARYVWALARVLTRALRRRSTVAPGVPFRMDAHTSPVSAPSPGDGAAISRQGDVDGPDFGAVFAAMPGINLLLAADPPRFTILAASDERLAATLTTREETLGRPLFEVFSDANPENGQPTGVSNLRASLETVLRTRAPHRMAVQRYDLRRPDGTWEVRHWAPRNVPVLGPDGAVRYIVHHVEDVTEAVRRAEAHDLLQGEYADSEDARHELEIANARLLDQQLELELANQQLQDQSAELELQAEDLQAGAVALEERTADAERARDAADAANRRLAFLAEASQ